MDIEKPARRHALSELAPWFDVLEEEPVCSGEQFGRVDILARPKDPALQRFALAFEVKTPKPTGFRNVAAWVKQCADYVEAKPLNGWPSIAAAFLWIVDGPRLDPFGTPAEREEHSRWVGMLRVGSQFRVGEAYRENAHGIVFALDGNVIFRGATGWTSRATTLLACQRQFMGRKARLSVSEGANGRT